MEKERRREIIITSALALMLGSRGTGIFEKTVGDNLNDIVTRVYALDNVEEEKEEEVLANKLEKGLPIPRILIEYKSKLNDEMVAKLAGQFSELYGIDFQFCLNIIENNIENTDNSLDVILALNDLMQASIGNEVIYSNENIFGIGTGNINYINEFKNTSRGQIFLEIANMYGVDYNLALALSKQEANLDHEGNLPGGDYFNGFGYGICQIENSLIGSRFEVDNLVTKNKEVIEIVIDYPEVLEDGITYLSVMDFSDNVRIGMARLQEKIKRYDYNIPLALMAYNYGDGALGLALKEYSIECGQNIEEIIQNSENVGWLNNVKHLHEEPTYYGISWPEDSTYGDKDYARHVLQYVPTNILVFEKDNEIILTNLTNQITITLNRDEIAKLEEKTSIIGKRFSGCGGAKTFIRNRKFY